MQRHGLHLDVFIGLIEVCISVHSNDRLNEISN